MQYVFSPPYHSEAIEPPSRGSARRYCINWERKNIRLALSSSNVSSYDIWMIIVIAYTLPYYVVLVISTTYLNNVSAPPQALISKNVTTSVRDARVEDEGMFIRLCDVDNVTVILDGYTLYTLVGVGGCFRIYKLSKHYQLNGNVVRFIRVPTSYKSNSSGITLYSSSTSIASSESIKVNRNYIISIIALAIEVLRKITALEAEEE